MGETDTPIHGHTKGVDGKEQSKGLQNEEGLGLAQQDKAKDANEANEDALGDPSSNVDAAPMLGDASSRGLAAAPIPVIVGQMLGSDSSGSGAADQTKTIANLSGTAGAVGGTTAAVSYSGRSATSGHASGMTSSATAAEAGSWSQDPARAAEKSATAPAWVGDLPPMRQGDLGVGEALKSNAPAALTAINTENPRGLKEGLSQQLLWMTSPQGASSAKLILHPEGLGAVEVRISTHQGEVNVAFKTDSVEGQRLIADALPELKQMLEPQGLRLAQTSVISAGAPGDHQGQAMFDSPKENRPGHQETHGGPLADGQLGNTDDASNSGPLAVPDNAHRGLINTYA